MKRIYVRGIRYPATAALFVLLAIFGCGVLHADQEDQSTAVFFVE